MFATALIVFRESLEAALFVGIVAVATRGLPGRLGWLLTGVGAGLAGALALAAGTNELSAWADGIGQDLVNAAILSLALVMLSWHCIWVSTHGQEMTREAASLGASTQRGERSPWALTLAVALAVLREGAETVLFVTGLTTGTTESSHAIVLGVGLGLTAGVALGLLLYLGLSRIKPHHLFPVTNTLILLLAAAIASQLARTLSQAGLVNFWSTSLWDSSGWLSETSPLGTLLHAMLGYSAQPSGLQLSFYLITIVVISLATRRVRERFVQRRHPPAGPTVSA